MMVSDKAGGGQRSERKESGVRGSRDRWRGKENQKSEERALEPFRKGWGEARVSKIDTEVDVKIACPLGRRRGEMPTRE